MEGQMVKAYEVKSPIEVLVKELEEELYEQGSGGISLLQEIREDYSHKTLEQRAQALVEAIKTAAPSKRQASEKKLMDSLMRIGFNESEAALFAGQEPSFDGWRRAMLSEEEPLAPVAEEAGRRHDSLKSILLQE